MKFGVIDFIWASLQVAFIVLKLCGVIDWSWWLVFAPVLFVVLFSTLCFVVVFGIKNYAERRDRRVKVERYGTANPLKIRMVEMQRRNNRQRLHRRNICRLLSRPADNAALPSGRSRRTDSFRFHSK